MLLKTICQQFHFAKAFEYSRFDQSHKTQNFELARLHAEAGLKVHKMDYTSEFVEWCASVGIPSQGAPIIPTGIIWDTH